ncbi:hypothetical protein IQ255_23715 [Pleurocapsales cyanobacterium LEGE 10410]|nr:hypothetical protein [Pleurocapsales cyanobacterium LEGE 10410]
MLISNLRFRPVLGILRQACLQVMLLGSLIGCQASLISVEEIAPKKVGRTIYLTGKVVHLAPFIDRAAYQIEDATGKIWIVTDQDLPQLNRQISIKGKVEYQSLPVAEQELGDFYVVELEQLESPSDQPQSLE